jgi:hypothetical protein
MRSPFAPGVCGAALPGTPARCERPPRHDGLHSGTLRWSDPDEAPTERLPPIRESIGPRRRPPELVARDLTAADRAELLRLMAAELEKDDQADEDDPR